MNLSEIYDILNIKYKTDKKINKIRTDSRLLNENDVFICIKNGYKYIEEALSKNVSLIITEKDTNYKTDIPIIKVESTIKILGIIAKYIRNKYKGVVIAITGSNGKTTTKELLSHVLESKYKILKNKDNLNNNIGVPNTILELDNTYDYLILELGTNHPGEIKYLSSIVSPNISIITNIGSSHIGNFGSSKNILKEKLDIKGDILFLNGEDTYLKDIDGIKVYRNEYDYKCIEHLTMDYYLVFKVCEYLKLSYEEVVKRVDSFTMINSRMNISVINNITLIDDAYNASLESTIGGINTLKKYNRKLIILGDILELGIYSEQIHKKIDEHIKKLDNYFLITLGNYTEMLNSDIHFNDIDKLIDYIGNINYYNYDVIYIKGSHKTGLYKIASEINKTLQNT